MFWSKTVVFRSDLIEVPGNTDQVLFSSNSVQLHLLGASLSAPSLRGGFRLRHGRNCGASWLAICYISRCLTRTDQREHNPCTVSLDLAGTHDRGTELIRCHLVQGSQTAHPPLRRLVKPGMYRGTTNTRCVLQVVMCRRVSSW